MTREELARISMRKQRSQIGTALIGLPVLIGSAALFTQGHLDQIHPRWLSLAIFPGIALAALAVILVNALHSSFGMPRCPHCKKFLMAWMLHIAVASGRCGYCGNSIETSPTDSEG